VAAPNVASIDRYRPLLRLQARQIRLRLDAQLKGLWESSDLVQDAFCRAVAKVDQFRGTTAGELVVWLQRILANIAKDKIKAAQRQKCDVGRLQALEQVVEDSSIRLDAFLAAQQSSPSERVARAEMLAQAAAAVEQLPEDQRDVIIYHYLHGKPVAQIAEQMGKTEKSVAGLLYRGMAQLREQLGTRS
jgi:RNA polymerase sigma-70 factor (ECF subfamily)